MEERAFGGTGYVQWGQERIEPDADGSGAEIGQPKVDPTQRDDWGRNHSGWSPHF